MLDTKSLLWLISIFIVISGLPNTHYSCRAQETRWVPRVDELQFGITATAGGIRQKSPSTLEPGYNGAFVFACCSYYGIGQTFTVPSLRTLESVQLRLGGINEEPTAGQIQIAISKFNTNTGLPGDQLGAILIDAEDYYLVEVTTVPETSFDLSSFNVLLNPAETYALAVTPSPTFAGGGLTLQSTVDLCSGGRAYLVYAVPEPSKYVLMLSALSMFATRRRR